MPKSAAARRAPIVSAAEPQLFVTDIETSFAFFAKLGFAIVFSYGEPPHYGQVRRDGAALNLRAIGEPVFAGDVREREELLAATITVATANDIKALYDEFRSAGVSFAQALKKQPWGARTFVVVDLDGNRILFAGPAA